MSIRNIEDAYPLTQVQRGILYHCLESPDTDVYISYMTLQFEGRLKPDKLKQAWQQTIERHTMLRTGFVWEGLDEPLQVVNAAVDLDWQTHAWNHLNTAHQHEQLNSLIASEKTIPFNLQDAPLFRFRLLQLSDDQWTLLWVVHHLLADGWSTPIILDEVLHHYNSIEFGSSEILVPAFRFADYVQWQNDHDLTDSLDYWRRQLATASNTLIKCHQSVDPVSLGTDDLKTEYGSSNQRSVSLTDCETSMLLKSTRQNRLTLATVIHSAWALVLQDFTDSSELLFGTTVSGRDIPLPGVEHAVGLFFNTMPLAVTVSGNSTISDFMQIIQFHLLAASKHSDVSLPQIRRMLNSERHELDFESIVVIESHSSNLSLAIADNSLRISAVDYQTYSNYPLALLAYPGDQLRLILVYNGLLFAPEMVQDLLQRVRDVLTSLLNNPLDSLDHYLGSLAHITDKHTQLDQSNEFTFSPDFPDIVSWFESTCDQYPDDSALRCDGKHYSFRQLDSKANQIAQLIKVRSRSEQSTSSSTAIGLCLERGPEQIAAMLGILKAGHAYIPIDANYPEDKILQLLDLAEASLVIGEASLKTALGKFKTSLLNVADAAPFSCERLNGPRPDTDSLAYIMFTSGSTGQPKGVRITHSNLVYSTQVRLEFYGERRPRFLLLSSISFDSSVAGIYWALCGGGTLVLPLPEQEKDLQAISGLIHSEVVTHTLCLSTLYALLLEHAAVAQLRSLQTVIVAGESCPASLPQQHFSSLPETRLFNEYGPTEACVWSTVHELNHSSTLPIPVGRPLDKTIVEVVNSNGRLCPVGIVGELCIAGPGVADGYHNNVASTEVQFRMLSISNQSRRFYLSGDLGYQDLNGNLVFVGRKDRQIKIRGHRIEPGEIEDIISRFPGVREVIVVARERSHARALITTKTDAVANGDLLESLLSLPDALAQTLLAEVETLSSDEAAKAHWEELS